MGLKFIADHPLIAYVGPDFSMGKMPAIIYFAVSKEESLTLDPFCQPVELLENKLCRVISFTLPCHGEEFDKMRAIQDWADQLKINPDLFSAFIKNCSNEIDALIKEGIIDVDHIASFGLSRGGYFATLLAAFNSKIKAILAFAPITRFVHLHEFQNEFDYNSIELKNIYEKLFNKELRFYIGNRDSRVGTECCFEFIKELTDKSYEKGIRSPKVELVISPSIGMKGHGTAPHTFQDGISWLISKL